MILAPASSVPHDARRICMRLREAHDLDPLSNRIIFGKFSIGRLHTKNEDSGIKLSLFQALKKFQGWRWPQRGVTLSKASYLKSQSSCPILSRSTSRLLVFSNPSSTLSGKPAETRRNQRRPLVSSRFPLNRDDLDTTTLNERSWSRSFSIHHWNFGLCVFVIMVKEPRLICIFADRCC